MGAIARGFAVISVIQAVVYQVSSQNQQPITQYVLSNMGLNGAQHGSIGAPQFGSNTPLYGSNAPQYGPIAPQYGSVAPQYGSIAPQYGSIAPTYGSIAPQYGSIPQTVEKPDLPLALSTLASAVSTAPIPQKKTLVPKSPEVTTGPLDSNVLNNLAIALQLLIVSNIMNIPTPPEKCLTNLPAPKFEISSYATVPSVLEVLTKPNSYSFESQTKPALYAYETAQLAKPSLYSYETTLNKPSLYSYAQSLPNANFVGSSGFSDPVFGSIGANRPNPRSSMTLMSPYDALGTSSFDPFPTTYSKKDFQSPYASIIAADGARDLFSMSDLF